MTLIAFYANQKYALVVADRRLTNVDGSIYEDDRTKLLTWCGGLTFGFTGQAFLSEGRKQVPSLEWLALRIAEQEPSGILDFNKIRQALDRQRLPLTSRRLAFGAIGFVADEPTALLISNMHAPDGSPTSTATARFAFSAGSFHGEWFKTLGGEVSPSARDLLSARMPEVRDRPDAVAQLMAGVIERSSNNLVGNQAMVVTRLRTSPSDSTFDVVTPNLTLPGVTTDIASPIFVCRGTVMQMPSQPMRRAQPPQR